MNVPFPTKGKNSTAATSRQPAETSSDMLNVRPFQASTGKRRGSQRPGTSLFNPTAMATKPVRLLAQVTYDARKFTYSASAGSNEWTALAKEAKRGVLDRQGNLYVIEGAATIVKLNDSGTVVWRLNPPIADPKQQIMALWVDPADFVYVGISSGGAQTTAKFWRFKQKQKSETPAQVWEFTPGAFVRKIITKGDHVYTLQNMPDRAQAFVVCYKGGLTPTITEAWRTEVAYPANSFVLKSNGDVVGCSLPNATRGIDPRFPLFTEKTIDWKITDLADYDRRLWIDLDMEKQVARYGKDGNGKDLLFEGLPFPLWYDSSGNARDFFTRIAQDDGAHDWTPPLFDARGLGGKPSAYFRGGNAGVRHFDSLQSGESPSTTAAYADGQRGLVPAYAGAKWAMFMVLRLEEERPTPFSRGIWGQARAVNSTATPVSMFANRNHAGTPTTGVGCFLDSVHASGLGQGTAGQPHQFQFGETVGNGPPGTAGNPTGVCIITIVHDGGDNSAADSAAVTHSLLRCTGQPIDRWLSVAGSSIDRAVLGQYQGPGNENLRGHIARVIVLRDYVGAPKGLLSHPNFPRNIGTTVANAPTLAWTPTSDLSTASEMEKIEGGLAHEYGSSHLLPTGAYIAPTFAPYVLGNYPHPFYRTFGPPRASNTNVRSEPYQMHTKNGCVWKLDGSKGELQWVLTGTSGEDGGGLGYSVAVDSDSNAIFSVGPKLAVGSALIDGTTSVASTGNINIRRFQDLNAKGILGFNTSVITGSSGWVTSLGTTADDFSSTDIECGLDDYSNLYVPINYAAIGPFMLKAYAAAPDGSGAYNVGKEIVSYNHTNTAQGFAVALPPSPSYRFGATYDFDRNPTTAARQARTEFVYVFTNQVNPADPGIYKTRLVTATPVDGTPRQTTLYQVNGGIFREFTSTTTRQLMGASTLAEPQLSGDAQYMAWDTLFGQLFITDGANYFYADPRDDAIRTWKSLDGGKIPPRCKLLVNWRGRAVLARGVDDPHGWHMSALEDPFGWDRFAIPQKATRAVSGFDSRIGRCPDVVNALYPYTDNILLFLCDHSIWAMVGDPADEGRAAGFQEVSSVTGGSFGRSCTTDPAGNFYFFGSQGGVFIMRPGSVPVSISDDSIFDELRNVNLATFHAELVWNTDDNGLHVFFIPYDSGVTTHYFWDRTEGGWFPDEFATQSHNPASVLVADGDLSGDRKLILAGQDGILRKWDRTAKNDCGTAINTQCLMGPFAAEDSAYEARFKDLAAVLASESDPTILNLYRSSVPDKKGAPRWTTDLQPGRNPVKLISMVGAYAWVEIAQSDANRSWSLESLAFNQVARAGRKSVTAA